MLLRAFESSPLQCLGRSQYKNNYGLNLDCPKLLDMGWRKENLSWLHQKYIPIETQGPVIYIEYIYMFINNYKWVTMSIHVSLLNDEQMSNKVRVVHTNLINMFQVRTYNKI